MQYSVLDTFAGAGGFSLGFELAGANVVGAIEMDSWACETFKFNHPKASVMQGDITAMSVKSKGNIERYKKKIRKIPKCFPKELLRFIKKTI